MKVVTLVNGSLSSHTTAIYALYYAKQMGAGLEFVYLKEENNVDEVRNHIQDIKDLADSFEIDNEFVYFETLPLLKEYLEKKDISILFCSTKKNSSLYAESFVRKIVRFKIPLDMAVVKVVKVGRAHNIEKIVMPIRDSKLSVHKFNFFSTVSLAYEAKSEIYSVDKISRFRLSYQNNISLKEKLQNVIFNLRHYLQLAKSMEFRFAIKHDYAFVEGERVQEHIAKHRFDLIIIGGHYSRNIFKSHPIDVLFNRPMVNTIYFIPYKEQL